LLLVLEVVISIIKYYKTRDFDLHLFNRRTRLYSL
jgi:hypothetical protein